MAISTWPVDLPLTLRYGSELEYGREEQKAITPMEGGNTLRRRRFMNEPVYLDVTLLMNDVAVNRLINYYVDELSSGTRPFIAPVLHGCNVVYHRCAFSMPSLKPLAETWNRWMIPVQFEIRGVVYVSTGAYWFIDYYGSVYGEEFADQIQIIVNTLYPDAVAGLDDIV